jgi:hypothetical protein
MAARRPAIRQAARQAGPASGHRHRRVGLERPQRPQHDRQAVERCRIGKAKVPRELAQHGRHAVVQQARQEEDPGVREIAALGLLHVPHGPVVEERAQAGARGRPHAARLALEPRGQRVDEPPGADAGVVPHHAEADGIGLGALALDQGARAGDAPVGADAPHMEGVAEEGGAELVVRRGRPEADAHDAFHRSSPARRLAPPAGLGPDDNTAGPKPARGTGIPPRSPGLVSGVSPGQPRTARPPRICRPGSPWRKAASSARCGLPGSRRRSPLEASAPSLLAPCGPGASAPSGTTGRPHHRAPGCWSPGGPAGGHRASGHAGPLCTEMRITGLRPRRSMDDAVPRGITTSIPGASTRSLPARRTIASPATT